MEIVDKMLLPKISLKDKLKRKILSFRILLYYIMHTIS